MQPTTPQPPSSVRRAVDLPLLLFGRERGIAGTVYGTVVVMATVAGESELDAGPWRLATLVASTVLVIWVGHMYADGLAECIHRQRLLVRDEVLEVVARELTIPLAAIGPVAALVAGALDIIPTSTAVNLAFGIGLLTLAAQGLRFARTQRLTGAGTLAAVGVNLVLGLLVVALKTLIAHH